MSGLVPLPTRLDWASSEHEIRLWFEPGGLTRISFVVASPVVASPTDNLEGLPRVANIKSQIKRNKQNEKAHQRNKAAKSSLRTSVRRFREAADAGNLDEAGVALRAATRQLDKAASKGVIHKNQAANRKSAIAKRYAELQAS
jgi:small subunit ribosomal protein S20